MLSTENVENVPLEEQTMYEELICNHHYVFRKNKSDLRSAKNFEHKIEPKDDAPKLILSKN
jgi:hypothetical protein